MCDSESSESSDASNDIFNDYVTLGKSSEFEEVVWLFPNTDQCPMKNCNLSCSSRSVCLGHFHLVHADKTMLCAVCNELIAVKNPLNLFRHYQDHHPKKPPPKLKSKTEQMKWRGKKVENSQKPKKKPYQSDREEHQNHSNGNEEKQNADDDAVILTGSGLICQWLWPKNLNTCQVRNCHVNVKNRREAINHFRATHAHASVLCVLCDKPIYAPSPHLFKRHYDRMHPNMAMPFNFNAVPRKSKKVRASSSLKNDTEYRTDSSDSDDDHSTNVPKSNGSSSKISKIQVKREMCEDKSDLVQLKYGEWCFPDTTICPVISCSKRFDSRLEAMVHYKQQHAMFSIYCHLCNKPIRIDAHKDGFIKHFQTVHPNKKIPYGLGIGTTQSTNPKFHAEEVDESDDRDESDEEDDDVIVLSGCGLKFNWKFPHTTKCPVKNCYKQFGVRSDVIVHYKRNHAKRSTLCPACNRPVLMRSFGDIAFHYKNRHPNLDLPPWFNKSSNKMDDNKHAKMETNPKDVKQPMNVFNQSNYHDESDDDDSDDMIVLSALGLKFTWQFPNTTNCPVQNCQKRFGVRSDAIVHYKKQHAAKSTLCHLCNRPKLVRRPGDIAYHYTNTHPKFDLPSYFKNLQMKEKVDNKHADLVSQTRHSGSKSCAKNVSQPSKEVHKKARLSCPLKSCNYETVQMTELCAHWTRTHGELEFPDYRGANKFSYVVDIPESTISKLSKGNGATTSSAPHKPRNFVTISSESDGDLPNGNTQKKTNGSYEENRNESGLGSEWFTLTSDDDDDDEVGQAQDDRKRKKSTEVSHSESNKKSNRSSSRSSSSHETGGKRTKYCSDNESCSD